MNKNEIVLHVFYETSCWVLLFERTCGTDFSVCKRSFVKEPNEEEVLQFILQYYDTLTFSPPLTKQATSALHKNPKRIQREVRKQLVRIGIQTKSQEALKLQQEQQNRQRKDQRKAKAKQERNERFMKKQEKRKKKHNGR